MCTKEHRLHKSFLVPYGHLPLSENTEGKERCAKECRLHKSFPVPYGHLSLSENRGERKVCTKEHRLGKSLLVPYGHLPMPEKTEGKINADTAGVSQARTEVDHLAAFQTW